MCREDAHAWFHTSKAWSAFKSVSDVTVKRLIPVKKHHMMESYLGAVGKNNNSDDCFSRVSPPCGAAWWPKGGRPDALSQ